MRKTFKTARLTLRPPRLEDADDIYRYVADWDVVRMIARPPWPYPRELAEEFARTAHALVIERQGSVIGAVGINRRPSGCMLGFWLGKAYWGRGLTSEAVQAAIGGYFAETAENDLLSGYFLDNPASWRIQDKCGFVAIGEERVHINSRGGEVAGMRTLLTREAFEKRRNP